MTGIFKLGINFFLSYKLRNLLTTVGIVLGVALIFAIQIAKQSTISSFSELVSDLSGVADIQITGAANNEFDENKFDEIRNFKEIDSSSPSITRLTFILNKTEKEQVQLIGVNPKIDYKFRNYKILEGGFLTRNENTVVLVKKWADDRNIKLSDKIKLSTSNRPATFRVVGLIAKTGPGNVYDGAIAIIPLKISQKYFRMSKQITQIDIKAKKETNISKLIKKLKNHFGDLLTIERPASKGKAIETSTRGLIDAFNSFGLIALLVGAFVVFNTMNINVAQRKRQIGLLRANGATRSQIMMLILTEAFVLGIIGSAFGLLLGFLMSNYISATTASIYKTVANKIVIPQSSAVTAFIIGVSASLISAIAPAWQASSISPVTAIRPELLSGKGWVERIGWLFGIGLVILSIFVIFIASSVQAITYFNLSMILLFIGIALFSVIIIVPLSKISSPIFKLLFKPEGLIASENIIRKKSRSALASVIVMMGLVLVLAAGEMTISYRHFVKNWLDSVVRVDLFVRTPVPFNVTQTGAYPRFSLNFIEKIKKIEGVKFVSPVTFLSTKSFGKDIFTIFTDPRKWRKTSRLTVEEGNPDKVLTDLENPDNVLISSTISAREKLKIGDYMEIKTSKGNKKFKVIGVIAELANDGYTIYLNRKNLKKHFNTEGADTFNILIKKGYRLDDVKKELREKVGNPYGLLVISGIDLRKDINKSVNQFLSMLSSIAIIAVIVSALGIINTLTMNVFERIREIGILRANGMTKFQIAKTVVSEGGIIGIIGGFMGILLGLVISKIILIIANLNSGIPLKYFFPYQYVILSAIIAVVVSILASIYPAYKASKINIIKAIQYE